MMFNQSLFGVRPKTFQAININFSQSKTLTMVDPQMPISTKHQGIIASEFIRIDNTSSSDQFNGHVQKGFGSYVWNHIDFNHAITLQNAENRHFSRCPPNLGFPFGDLQNRIHPLRFHLAKEFHHPDWSP